MALQKEDFPMLEEAYSNERINLNTISNTFFVVGIFAIICGILSFAWNLTDMLLFMFCPHSFIGSKYMDIVREDLVGGIQAEENKDAENSSWL